jgi:hypothetical protein
MRPGEWGDRCGREAGAGGRGGTLAEGQAGQAGADSGTRCVFNKQVVIIGGKSSLTKANISRCPSEQKPQNTNAITD